MAKPFPLIVQEAFEAANGFLAKLRVFARLPQIRPLIPTQNPWQVQFLNNDRELLPEENDRLRMVRAAASSIGVFAFKSDAVKSVVTKWDSREPYVWDQLLLDSRSLWPDIGSAIVTAYAALETFIAWALEILQSEHHRFPDDAWKWIMKRDHWAKEPSVEEQFDNLLSTLATKSLKSDQKLWTVFRDLKKARNNLVHEGTAKLSDGKALDADKAKSLVDGAAKIIDWVEQLLPEDRRRYNTGSAIGVKRRFATDEEARLYRLASDHGAPDPVAASEESENSRHDTPAPERSGG